MIRTSSVRRPLAVLGVAVAAAALSACGTAPARQGAAAVVGTDRISIAQVEARVAAVRDGAAASGAATEEQPGLARHAVSDLILGKLIAQALADRQLGVSQAEVDRARTADAKTLGGEAKLTELLRAKQGVPAGDVDGFYRQQIGLVKLAGGQDPNGDAGDAAIRKALVDAGTALHVEVNPRYGSWDTARIGLTDSTEDWLPKTVRTL
ncbi:MULTISPECIES: SurA N-terminal domain-containing protein [Kitasatospora]|uniref:Putative lipoprotein n=1 Tax=Kitasatospora setae (strain ATCC 33774 / DSM 43861 / JCM 3304 / KCC A-0304 / NBRC 14216 / KM-6054) TaxID=452652 RepID=E4NG20_KITSK|nr:SurA N-terminal domain-containing protein [Kitasatospora setae]BAJ30450.1 putative lipoprotein [Kitasatospora setae KM-6054]